MGKKIFLARILLCFFLMIFLIIAGCASSSDQTLSYSIEGYVIDSASEGVENVIVDLSTADHVVVDNTIIATTSTNENGRYIFTGLSPDGLYTVTPSLPGCTFQVEINTFENAPSQDISLSGASVTCPNFVATCAP
jgi:hypothetical protein